MYLNWQLFGSLKSTLGSRLSDYPGSVQCATSLTGAHANWQRDKRFNLRIFTHYCSCSRSFQLPSIDLYKTN